MKQAWLHAKQGIILTFCASIDKLSSVGDKVLGNVEELLDLIRHFRGCVIVCESLERRGRKGRSYCDCAVEELR